jgi:hypothetical protein
LADSHGFGNMILESDDHRLFLDQELHFIKLICFLLVTAALKLALIENIDRIFVYCIQWALPLCQGHLLLGDGESKPIVYSLL